MKRQQIEVSNRIKATANSLRLLAERVEYYETRISDCESIYDLQCIVMQAMNTLSSSQVQIQDTAAFGALLMRLGNSE